MSDNPQQGNSRVQRDNKPRPKKGGSGCGCFLVLLLILIALGGGGYYLVKNGQIDLSSLNLPDIPGLSSSKSQDSSYENYGNPTYPANQEQNNQGGLSQSEPFKPPTESPQNQPTGNNQAQATPQATQQQNPGPRREEKLYKSKDGKTSIKRVRRVSPRRRRRIASHGQHPAPINNYHRKLQPQKIQTRESTPNPNKLINYKSFNPKKGIITGSLESLVASRKLNPFNLATKPSQIITFQSPFYKYEEALNEYTQKLTKLGFKRISIPINDYHKGGSTVLQAYDKEGNQIYVSFKPIKEWQATSWRIEIYKSYKQ